MINLHRSDELTPAVTAPQSGYAALALGLHAAAQPLTILLAGLAKEYTDSMQMAELREVAACSALEVQRVCALFHLMQQLVSAESVPPEMAFTSILPMLRQVAESVRPRFEQDAVELSWVLPPACPPLWLDRAQTMDALTHVLLAAHRVLRRNDALVVAMSSLPAQTARIVVYSPSASSGASSSASPGSEAAADPGVEVELRMAIAQAIVRRQHGVCVSSLNPFRVEIEWQQR